MRTSQDTIASPGQPGKHGDICDTPTLTALTNMFHLCQAERELGVLTGEPGIGKSTAARRYVADNGGAHLVTMSPAASSLVPCLGRIGDVLGAFAPNQGAYAWSAAIRGALAYQLGPQVLLIDEAHHLTDASVEEIRAIFDAANVGVVFIGSREIRERWSGKRWAQLTSRVFLWVDLGGAMPGDIDAICTAGGIDGKRPRDLLTRAANTPGGLRVVSKILEVATKLAGPGNPRKAEHIEAAYRQREAKT